MNPLDNTECVQVRVYTSEGEKYGAETVLTPEIIENMGYDQVGSESLRILLDVLGEAYDREFYWENGNVKSTHRQRVWEKVKNINTDDELEEIRRLLGVEHEE